MTLEKHKMERLQGRAALVTGGSRGIGAAIARRLSSEGAAVAITYLSSQDRATRLARELVSEGRRVIAIRADCGDVDSIRSAVTKAAASLGRLDILVNNGALAGPGLISDFPLESLDRIIAVNITGVYVATQEALRHMCRGGRIINVGSISSDYMPLAGQSAYVMTKAAVSGLTRGLARELAARGITVNNVQPGRVDTDMLREATGSRYEEVTSAIPLGRLGEPEEVAAMVAYLCSGEASYVTGAHFRIDGGTSV